MNERGFSPLIILLGILVLIFVLGSAYYLGTQNSHSTAQPSPTVFQSNPTSSPVVYQPTPKPSVIPSPALDTSGWKTYTNTKYGYSFMYPSNVALSVGGGRPVGGGFPVINDQSEDIVVAGLEILASNPFGKCSDLLSDQLIRTCLGSPTWLVNNTLTPIIIGGKPGVKRGIPVSQANGSSYFGYTYYINSGTTGLTITFPDQTIADQSLIPISSQILSTIKFTK